MPFRIIHYWKDVCKKVVLKDTKQNQLTKKVPLQQICHKKRFTATTYKEIAETTFCRRSQQEQKFATWSRATIIKQDVVKTNKVSQKCCLLWERNVLKIWKKKNSNKVVRKDNLQKSYQKRPFAKNDKNKQIQNKKYQEDWCEIRVVYLGKWGNFHPSKSCNPAAIWGI